MQNTAIFEALYQCEHVIWSEAEFTRTTWPGIPGRVAAVAQDLQLPQQKRTSQLQRLRRGVACWMSPPVTPVSSSPLASPCYLEDEDGMLEKL